MFGLLYGLYQQCVAKSKRSVVMVGLDNAGKTSLLERLKLDYDPRYKEQAVIVPTIGLNLGRLHVGPFLMEVFDLGGQVSLRSIWDKYWADCAVLLFVVDASDPVRFAEARQALMDTMHRKRDNTPIGLVANKADLLTNTESARAFFGDALASPRVKLLSVSALTGEGVGQLMDWLALQF